MMRPYFWFVLCVFAFLPPLNAWSSLTPPAGNSLAIKTKILNGENFYKCKDGDWLLESAHATLVHYLNPSNVVGNYSWVQTPDNPDDAGTWFLYNNDGDLAESGDLASLVSGNKFMTAQPSSPRDLPDFLALASKHDYGGAGSLVSYIARVNTKGGVPLENGTCQNEDKLIMLPLDGEFHFWKQDLVPPNAPVALAVVSDRAVQGVFAQGIITYVYEGLLWKQMGITAELYNVPGGTKVGSFFIRGTPDNRGGSSCWRFDNPGGFEIVGKPAINPISVTPECLPWSLNVITSSSRESTVFGEYSHVQMVSTTGGLPPAVSVDISIKPKLGQVYRASFTAIYWVYCRSTM